MKGINTCLWFEGNGEEAFNFYLEVFPDAKVIEKSWYSAGMHMPEGTFLAALIQIAGHEVMILNAGEQFKLSPAVSLTIKCETQEEIDTYWSKLGEGGEEMACGWVTDRFGLTWQVVPATVWEYINDPDKERLGRYWSALTEMTKIDIAVLESARAV